MDTTFLGRRTILRRGVSRTSRQDEEQFIRSANPADDFHQLSTWSGESYTPCASLSPCGIRTLKNPTAMDHFHNHSPYMASFYAPSSAPLVFGAVPSQAGRLFRGSSFGAKDSIFHSATSPIRGKGLPHILPVCGYTVRHSR